MKFLYYMKPRHVVRNLMAYPLTVLTAFVLLASCNSEAFNRLEELKGESLRSDTSKPIISSSFQSKAYPNYFELAFHESTKSMEEGETFRFYTLNIGKLKVETGKIIACDPIVMHDASPFTQNFPLGEYPVQLAMKRKEGNGERVALSRILFSNEPVVKWEYALLHEQKPMPINDTSIYCYGVDAGTGVFIDSLANTFFKIKDEKDWKDIFITKAEKHDYTGYMHDFEGYNLATFSTGFGDGCYATYIGFDKNGKVCQLLTDFGLTDWGALKENK